MILSANNQDIFKQVKEFLESRTFDESVQIKVAEIKPVIYDIINGKTTFLTKCNLLLGCPVKGQAAMTDSELLMVVLKNCSEDVLLELEHQFGKKSRISEIIRERIIGNPKSDNGSAENTIMTLEYMLNESEKNGNKLYSLICKYMDEEGYKSDADFYNSISMSRQNFARIRNKTGNIGKDTVLWIICGLRLDYIQAHQVLNAAGYTFKSNDKRDVIISYIIKNVEHYDLDMVNEVLYHFGLRTFFDD